jgi:ATP-dependent helicase Lhr and Lhr-like helicase
MVHFLPIRDNATRSPEQSLNSTLCNGIRIGKMVRTPNPNQDLPEPFRQWFAARGWTLRPHQRELLAAAREGLGGLVIAPTGGGKTLAGFLPSLIELAEADRGRAPTLHTLYVSPLKALATDVARNLTGPVADMRLHLSVEVRTGDTSPSRRQRQRAKPPDILLTTPEQLALLAASEHAGVFFRDLRAVIVDEIHAIASTKRGDMLALCLAALRQWSPGVRLVGLSATVRDPASLAGWLFPGARVIRHDGGAQARIDVLDSEERIPWSGHSGRHAVGEIYQAIRAARMALVFVNTRSQAEMMFQELWRANADALPIALHHGSLDIDQRRKVESAMAAGALKAVVCTSTLDLGIDWGDVDLVVQVGAPKGSSRLIQRIGRSNHRMDEPSRALLAPSNRFEVLECRAAVDAVAAGELDGPPARSGAIDVLAQHVMGRACGDGFDAAAFYEEVTSAQPYAALPWETWERVVDFVATGGYALRTYDRFRRIVRMPPDRLWRARNDDVRRQHRMNVGVIVESPMVTVRMAGPVGARTPGATRVMRAGRKLGEMEEYFFEMLTPGDTFLFAGQILKFEALVEGDALVSRSYSDRPAIPSYNGGKFPLTTFLAARVRRMLHDPAQWPALPAQVREWITMQKRKSAIPGPEQLLVETFPRGDRWYLVCYPFEGRLAHQTLGMLLTRRLDRAGFKPLGFVASEYALSVWGMEDMSTVDMDALFHQDMLGDDLDAWLQESALMKRTFRYCALISGMVERRRPGGEKTGRQVTFSTDLIYDVLRSHEPDHILLQAARQDAGDGLLDIRRLGEALERVRGRIIHSPLTVISPFAVPVMLEIGREPVSSGGVAEAILREAEDDLVRDAMG